MNSDPARRDFLKQAALAGGGLVVTFSLGIPPSAPANPGEKGPFAPNAFLRIAADGSITVVVGKTELGQGVFTSLPMLVAEELEADWATVRFESAPVDPAYNSTIAPMQFTGGSLSVRTCFDQLRNAGATAREMLVAAAARKWGVDASSCRAREGRVHCEAIGKSASFGELAELASTLPRPEKVALKDAATFRLVGKPTKRLDSWEKVTGKSRFGADVTLPGMVTAVVLRSPYFGGTLEKADTAKALAVPGVLKIEPVPSGLAVYAKDTASALRGRRALAEARWNAGPMQDFSTGDQRTRYEALARTPGTVVRKDGNADESRKNAYKELSAVYVLPYLAHASMEPLNCTVDLQPDSCVLWTGTQMQTGDLFAAAKTAGLKPEQVRLHTTMAGGGFGRRANPVSDFVVEAVEVAKKAGSPVKVLWTREDDMQGGFYRPFSVSFMEGGVARDGSPVFWTHRIAAQSILMGTPFEKSMVKDGVDETTVEGAKNLPYAIPNLHVELQTTTEKVPVLWWRSVGHSANAFTTESFIDELAHLAGEDPYHYRRKLLLGHPRWLGVLDLAAQKAGWGEPLEPGRARGIAVHESFGSFVAQVAEVSLENGARVKVHRVTCAVDCGVYVNPLTIEAQMQGGIAFGLSAALYGSITFKEGRVEQSNFHNYKVLPFGEMPKVDVHLVKNAENPGGVGEPGTPPIAPAVTNALFALTGKRVRRLPIDPKLFAT